MLKDKVCLISGCSRGIGKTMVQVFAREGAVVYANARTEGCLDEYCRQVSEEYHTDVIPLYFDISNDEQIRNNFMRIKKEQKRLDVLVNNAAVASNELLEMVTREELQQMFDTNVFSLVSMMQMAVRIMKRQGSGSIINISSCVGIDGNPGQLAYSATKGAVNAITKTAAKELAASKIRVNAVAPGLTRTEMYDKVDEEKLKERTERIMLGRLANQEDIANSCAFLASDKADYITGQILKVDGCMLM